MVTQYNLANNTIDLNIANTYMSTQREVLEGQTGSHRAKRANFGRGVRKISKIYIANGAIYVIPELYLWILLAYIVKTCINYVSCNTI